MKNLIVSCLIVFLASVPLTAQQKTSTTEKPQPEPRRLDTPPSTEATTTDKGEKGHLLPKIDLPEFVITGVASIDVPNVDKLSADEIPPLKMSGLTSVSLGNRERETYELSVRQKQLLNVVHSTGFSAKVLASVGTYKTPTVGFWVGQVGDEYRYLIDGHYQITKGFAPYTNRSRGGLGMQGGMKVHSGFSLLNGSNLSGGLRYGSETYRFYGSRTPRFTRTISDIGAQSRLVTLTEGPVDFDLSVGYKTYSFADSSFASRQNQFDALLESRIPAGEANIIGRVEFSSSVLKRGGSRSFPYLDASLGSSTLWWGRLFVQASAHFYLAKGDLAQDLTRIYPHLSLGYHLSGSTTLLASYKSEMIYQTLATLVENNPYLSAALDIRHSDVTRDIVGAMETDWNEQWQTRFSARYRSVRDYPLYRDVGSQGIWDLVYGSTTTFTTFQADVFAKFRPNGYFALTIVINSTKNSLKQIRIPYVSDLEIAGSFSHTFPFGLSVAPRVSFVDSRNVDLLGSAKLPEFWLIGVRSEYDLFQSFKLFVDFHNVADRKYELWRGYRALPFVLTGGLTYQW